MEKEEQPLRGHSVPQALVLLVADCCCAFLSAFLTAVFTYPPTATFPLRDHYDNCLAYALAFIFVWFWVALLSNLFRPNGREQLHYHAFSVFKAAVISLAFSGLAMIYVSPGGPEPRAVTYFGILILVTLVLCRSALFVSVWAIRQWGWNFRYVVLVGANDRTRHLVEILLDHNRFGYHIVGILEDEQERLAMLGEHKVPYLGGFQDLEHVLADKVVDEVHICLPVRSYYETIQSIAHYCVSVGVSVRLIADLFPLRLATSRLHRIEDIPMLSLSTVPESAVQLAIKRLGDIVISLVLLVLLSPFLLVVAVLIKLDSPGPVFFAQERIGLNQRRFKMWKFRSMVADAEERKQEVAALNETDGPVFKIRDDPRITRVGKFIRKYSIDEFPQLVNVLIGHMSLVGPRPLPVGEIERYSWDQRRRLSVKPGMTGLWQVSGRSDVTFNEWVQLDLTYIDTWSLSQDVRILFKTFRAVVLGRGAA